eukprot:TRINITY_DN10984_c0_g2_i1.p1 TRINITY_DN10984_c0_g2~~TRINITY_DN10984_c0_g2_i1.p1  ORF type:complete len:104 (+),score=2.96 TRINITY_DN10984_c0_g2_i1:127-438(+)
MHRDVAGLQLKLLFRCGLRLRTWHVILGLVFSGKRYIPARSLFWNYWMSTRFTVLHGAVLSTSFIDLFYFLPEGTSVNYCMQLRERLRAVAVAEDEAAGEGMV